jgi:hypothetical protein
LDYGSYNAGWLASLGPGFLDNFWVKGVGEEFVASRNGYSKISCSGKKITAWQM